MPGDAPPITDTPTPTPAPTGGGFSSWSKGKQYGVVGGGIVGLGLLYYIIKKRSSSSTAATGQVIAVPSSQQLAATGPGGYGNGGGGGGGQGSGNLANLLAANNQQLEAYIAGLQPTSITNPTAPTPIPAPIANPITAVPIGTTNAGAVTQLNSGLPSNQQVQDNGNLTYNPTTGYSGTVTSPSGLEQVTVGGGGQSTPAELAETGAPNGGAPTGPPGSYYG